MAVRQIEPIDRAELRATIQKWIDAHTDVDDTDGVGLLEDVLWEINAQPTLTPPNEWVSVEERLPENGQIVLFHQKDGFIYCAEYFAGKELMSPEWIIDNDSWNAKVVTHWMPLPEPPDSRPPEGEEGDANRG